MSTLRSKLSIGVLSAAVCCALAGSGAASAAAQTTSGTAGTTRAVQGLGSLTGTPKGVQNIGPRLNSGAMMTETQYLGSANGQHRLAIDGWLDNAVGLYLSSWSSSPRQMSTTGSSADVTNVLRMQGDGNLVLYTNGKATWNSGTSGKPGAYAVLQDDRDLVVYSADGKKELYNSRTPASDAVGFQVMGRQWTSELVAGWKLESPSRTYSLQMQPDGNLVLYKEQSAGKRTWLWHSRSSNKPGARMAFQSDGNLVVYSAKGQPLFNTGTGQTTDGVYTLILQDDGNLVEYVTSTTGLALAKAVWNTRTSGGVRNPTFK